MNECSTGNCTPESYVHVAQNGDIWVCLPGDSASHQLLLGEARKLFRELEEVV